MASKRAKGRRRYRSKAKSEKKKPKPTEIPEKEQFREKKTRKLSVLAKMNPRHMVVYPIIVFFIAIVLLAVHPPNLGIDLKGGVVVTAYNVNANPSELVSYIKEKTNLTVQIERFTSITGMAGVRIYASAKADSAIIENAIKEKYPNARVVSRQVSPTFGKVAQRQGIKAVLFAFIGMAIVVFLFFRNPISSGAIIFSALSDMTIALAVMGIVGIKLTTATIAALLMLIGYTVDSNILLTTRLTKRKEDTIEDAYLYAVSTGFTMSTTTLAALTVLYFVSTSSVIDNIAAVLIFGLLADFMNTWIFNAGVLRWYLSRPNRLFFKGRAGRS